MSACSHCPLDVKLDAGLLSAALLLLLSNFFTFFLSSFSLPSLASGLREHPKRERERDGEKSARRTTTCIRPQKVCVEECCKKPVAEAFTDSHERTACSEFKRKPLPRYRRLEMRIIMLLTCYPASVTGIFVVLSISCSNKGPEANQRRGSRVASAGLRPARGNPVSIILPFLPASCTDFCITRKTTGQTVSQHQVT